MLPIPLQGEQGAGVESGKDERGRLPADPELRDRRLSPHLGSAGLGEAGLLPDGSSALSLSRPVPDTWIQAPNVTQDAAGPSGSHRATAKVGALGRLGALASPSRKQRDLGRPAGPTQLPVQHPGEPGARLPLRSPARRAPLHRAGRQRPGWRWGHSVT